MTVPADMDIKIAKEVLQEFLKARKNLRLYPSNNPIYARTIENTYKKINDFFEFQNELDLRIARNEIFYGPEAVYQGSGKDENLALFFFRDGLRRITFKKGLTEEELRDFLEILGFDFEREDIEDDVVTLMWGKDFQNIKYTVDETVLVEDEEYEEEATKQAKESAAAEDDLERAYEDALKAEEKKEITPMSITEKDLKALAELTESNVGDKKKKLADILFEMLYQAETMEEYKDITDIMNNMVEFSVRQGDLESAVSIFERAAELIKVQTSKERSSQLNIIFWYASSAGLVEAIGELLDSPTGIDDALFKKYVGFLDKSAIPHLMSMLGDLKSIAARKNVMYALILLGRKDIATLAKGLGDDRWYVVRNIICVLRGIGDRKAVEYLIKMAGHSEMRVRKEALKALGEFGGQAAAQTIKGYLEDPEQPVRLTAVRALGSIGSEYAKNAVLKRVSDKKFLHSEFNEKKECFDVLSRWKDETVFDFLMKTVKKTPLFKRAKYNELRACAAYSLGLMGNKDSLPALQKLEKSSNKLLREYSHAALRRLEYGR